ncbi:AMP-binding protein [Pseudonocardia phyllosphaerae]|uniref:AMP-binding protein n=1 Tax=Pseudonocardia phyllosphaerae TaxID=3390502 RepID=UPI00397CEF43
MKLEGVCPLTVHEALDRAAAFAPDVEAVVTAEERITYGELAEEVARIRAALVAAGIGRGDRVGLALGNGPCWVALFLALGSVGAVTVPVNTRLTGDEIHYTLAHAAVSTLFTADRVLRVDLADLLRDMGIGTDGRCRSLPALRRTVVVGSAQGWGTPFREFLAGATDGAEPTAGPDDVLLVQYTSGTTSRPKGVLLTHRSMCADAFFSGARMGLRPGDRFHSARPFFHVAGSTLSVLASIQHACTLVTMARFEPVEALRLLEAERCSHFSGNDTIALLLLNHPERDRHTLHLRGAWVAASPTVIRRVIDELGARECVAGYGLSEASPNVAQSAWWEPEELRASGAMAPEPGVEVRIRSAEGHDCAPGEPGSIEVRGWNVMQGYLDDPARTAETIDAEGWLATGDLGALDASGRLHFVGRTKDVIRVGGENVAPAEIEDALHRHPSVRQAAVVGVPDERLVEVPFAFVVLTESEVVTPEAILEWAGGHLARFKLPRHLRVVEGFEDIGMTASSKIQKNKLAAHARLLLEQATG